MSYVVNWQGPDGQSGWHPVSDVQEATSHVEHLRNAEGVEVTRIYRLDEVPFEFKAYFRVELARPSTSFAASIAPEVPPAEAAEPVEDAPVEVVEGDAELDSVNGAARRGLFGR